MGNQRFNRHFLFILAMPVTALAITVAQAAPASAPMYVSVFEGHSGAAEIIDGDYAEGERLTRAMIRFAKWVGRPSSERLELYVNLCVAQIMKRDGKGARKSCDRAVSEAKRLRPTTWQRRNQIQPARAAAFCNRGVERALDGDIQGAKADFDAALRLQPSLENAAKNLQAASGSENEPFFAVAALVN